jgi:hypothetical protein
MGRRGVLVDVMRTTQYSRLLVSQEIIDDWDFWNQIMRAEVERAVQEMLEWQQWLEDDAEPRKDNDGKET